MRRPRRHPLGVADKTKSSRARFQHPATAVVTVNEVLARSDLARVAGATSVVDNAAALRASSRVRRVMSRPMSHGFRRVWLMVCIHNGFDRPRCSPLPKQERDLSKGLAFVVPVWYA